MRVFILTVIALLAMAAAVFGDMSTCVDATCRVSCPGGRGSGVVISATADRVLVLSNAHVVDAPSPECEFWSHGHQSLPVTGSVVMRNPSIDVAVIAIPTAAFGGRVPPAIPIARDMPAARETVTSIGCADGNWATGWKGHLLGYPDASQMRFLPSPAGGRSGSALFNADATEIVGLIRARTPDDREGIAIPAPRILAALGHQEPSAQRMDARAGAIEVPLRGLDASASLLDQPATCAGWRAQVARGLDGAVLTQVCPPGGCPDGNCQGGSILNPFGSGRVLPYRQEQDQYNGLQNGRIGRLENIYPTLPVPGPAPSARPMVKVDMQPVVDAVNSVGDKLDGFGTAFESIDQKLDVIIDQTAEPLHGTGYLRPPEPDDGTIDDPAVLDAIDATNDQVTALAKITQAALGDRDTLMQRMQERLDKVEAENPEASALELAKLYAKDYAGDKGGELGWTGGEMLAGVAGIGGIGALVLSMMGWLIGRDIGDRIKTGDPLMIEKLMSRFGGGGQQQAAPNITYVTPPAQAPPIQQAPAQEPPAETPTK